MSETGESTDRRSALRSVADRPVVVGADRRGFLRGAAAGAVAALGLSGTATAADGDGIEVSPDCITGTACMVDSTCDTGCRTYEVKCCDGYCELGDAKDCCEGTCYTDCSYACGG